MVIFLQLYFALLDTPGLPGIYISFEKTLPESTTITAYDRGKDKNGNSQVTMVNGAKIEQSNGRSGRVLKMRGTNAGATVGYFKGHALK